MKKSFLLIIAFILSTTLFAPCLIFANKAKNGITTMEELNGKAIGVQTGVLYEDVANSGISAKEALPESPWLYYKMPNDMIAALESNKIAAYLIEEVGFFQQNINQATYTQISLLYETDLSNLE